MPAFTTAQLLLAGVRSGSIASRSAPLWTVPIQQVVYRQLLYLVIIQSVASAVAGSRLRWHKLRRIGPPDLRDHPRPSRRTGDRAGADDDRVRPGVLMPRG